MMNGNGHSAGAFPLLRRTELSKFLTDAELKELERTGDTTRRSPGRTLFRQGEGADHLYVVMEGSVELRARPPGRRAYRTVEVVGQGCTLGDESVLEEDKYLAGARVLEPATLLALPRQAVERLAGANPAIAIGLLKCAGSCMIQTLRRTAILTQAPADVALDLLLKEMATDGRRSNGRVPVRITHAQLAGMLHLSRETVSRMLAHMAEEGSVRLARGVIHVRSQAAA